MYQKLQKEEWLELKLVRPIIPALKYGMTDLMILNAIFGHSAALFTKWLL